MDTALNEDQMVLGRNIARVALKVLADCNGLTDKAVQILRQLAGQTVGTQDTRN